MFIHRQITELPFILNIPNGEYMIYFKDTNYVIEINNDFYCLSQTESDTPNIIFIGRKSDADKIKKEYQKDNYSIVKLRTTITLNRYVEEYTLQSPTIDDFIGKMIDIKNFNILTHEDRVTKTIAELGNLPINEREQLTTHLSKIKTAKKLFSPEEGYNFIKLINYFLQKYSTILDDIFISEVSLHELASTNIGGIVQIYFFNNEFLENSTLVGKVPPIFRTNWFEHESVKIDTLKKALSAGESVESSKLLINRAKNLFEKGAYRSAIIEASAALENFVLVKIMDRLPQYIGSKEKALEHLKQRCHQEFNYRCKELFKELYGFSLSSNNNLWGKVVASRKNLRHQIAHSSHEPTEQETIDAITCFDELIKYTQSQIDYFDR